MIRTLQEEYDQVEHGKEYYEDVVEKKELKESIEAEEERGTMRKPKAGLYTTNYRKKFTSLKSLSRYKRGISRRSI